MSQSTEKIIPFVRINIVTHGVHMALSIMKKKRLLINDKQILSELNNLISQWRIDGKFTVTEFGYNNKL